MDTQEHPNQEPSGGRPARKNKRTFGAIALCFGVVSLLLLLGVGISLLLSFLNGALAGSDLTLVKTTAIICVVLCAVSMVFAVLTFFRKGQKKGMAVAAVILSLLMTVLCAVGLYLYEYTIGNLKQDEQFNNLSHEELNVVQIADDGEVVRETEDINAAMNEENRELAESQIYNDRFDKTIEWEYIDYADIPADARKLIEAQPPASPSYLLKGSDQITNYLLFGLDVGGASDSIMLMSVDRAHKKLKMISLPRDSYVWIEKWGTYSKLAYPYFWGGAEMAVQTVNKNFYLDITDYVTVDFDQLAALVDLVGGVDVELDYDEVYAMRHKQSGLYVGMNHLYGEAALYYARIRKSNASDNELNRTGRQREVLMSMMQSVKQMPLADYPAFIRECLGMCTTSIAADELLDIAFEVAQGNYTVEAYNLLELKGVEYWGGVFGEAQYFYCVMDLQRASDAIYKTIYEDLYLSGFAMNKEIDDSTQ